MTGFHLGQMSAFFLRVPSPVHGTSHRIRSNFRWETWVYTKYYTILYTVRYLAGRAWHGLEHVRKVRGVMVDDQEAGGLEAFGLQGGDVLIFRLEIYYLVCEHVAAGVVRVIRH